jgi:hypothetical protein
MGMVNDLSKLRIPKPNAEVSIENNGLHDFLNNNPMGRLKLKPLARLHNRANDPVAH